MHSTTFGVLGWLNPPATAYGAAATAAGRPLVTSDAARFLAATLLGALVAWDIPTSLAVPRLRKPDVLVHHLAMAATALVGSVYLPTHYGLYYMGCPASAPRDPRPRARPPHRTPSATRTLTPNQVHRAILHTTHCVRCRRVRGGGGGQGQPCP